jgi:hypothetical protein
VHFSSKYYIRPFKDFAARVDAIPCNFTQGMLNLPMLWLNGGITKKRS